MRKTEKKALELMRKELNNPGHKAEKKAFNNALRGERVAGTKVIPLKPRYKSYRPEEK